MENELQKAQERKDTWHKQFDYMLANKKWHPDATILCQYCADMLIDIGGFGRACVEHCPHQISCWNMLRYRMDYWNVNPLPQEMLDSFKVDCMDKLDQEFEATYGTH